jgi:hypothetical protein
MAQQLSSHGLGASSQLFSFSQAHHVNEISSSIVSRKKKISIHFASSLTIDANIMTPHRTRSWYDIVMMSSSSSTPLICPPLPSGMCSDVRHPTGHADAWPTQVKNFISRWKFFTDASKFFSSCIKKIYLSHRKKNFFKKKYFYKKNL